MFCYIFGGRVTKVIVSRGNADAFLKKSLAKNFKMGEANLVGCSRHGERFVIQRELYSEHQE